MKMSFFLLMLLGILLFNNSEAQNLLTVVTSEKKDSPDNPVITTPVFKFKGYSREHEINNITSEMAGNHPFGESVAKKLYLFNEKYTSQVALAPGNPAMKTVIKKPLIYESVKRIEKDLKRSVRKGEIPHNSASSEFDRVLDVALNILINDTKEFEIVLGSLSSTASKIDLFTKRVIINY